MEKLRLKFTSNNNVVIEDTISYYIKDNIVFFKAKDRVFNLNLIKKILNVKDKEKELSINFNDNVIIITLLNNNIKVDYPISNSMIDIKDNYIYLEYVLDSDEIIKNVIEIEYD